MANMALRFIAPLLTGAAIATAMITQQRAPESEEHPACIAVQTKTAELVKKATVLVGGYAGAKHPTIQECIVAYNIFRQAEDLERATGQDYCSPESSDELNDKILRVMGWKKSGPEPESQFEKKCGIMLETEKTTRLGETEDAMWDGTLPKLNI